MTDVQQLPLVLNYGPQCELHPTGGEGEKINRERERERGSLR